MFSGASQEQKASRAELRYAGLEGARRGADAPSSGAFAWKQVELMLLMLVCFDVLCSMSAFGTLADVHDAWPAWS